jgi:hypothetical protein
MFRPTFVLTADSARARMFRVDAESSTRVPELIEVSNLIHPEARVAEGRRYSDSMTLGGRSVAKGSYHGYDDHREEHEIEERRRFAKQVALTLEDLAQSPCHVVGCSSHTMHRHLADAVERSCRKAHVEWHMAEYTQLSPDQLAETLVAAGHLEC